MSNPTPRPQPLPLHLYAQDAWHDDAAIVGTQPQSSPEAAGQAQPSEALQSATGTREGL